MKFSRPIWNNEVAGLFLRCSLGAYFFIVGRYSIDHLNAFISDVHKYSHLPDPLATLYGVLIPYLQVVIGVFLMAGMWTSLAAIAASVVLASFVFGIGIFPDPGTKIPNKDIILMAASLALLSCGAGSFSIDSFRAKG